MDKLTIIFYRLLTWSIGIAVILIIIRVVGFQYYFSQFMTKTAVEAVAKTGVINLDLHKLQVSLVPPRIEAYGVQITDRHSQNHMIKINYLRADLSLVSLLVGKVQFHEVKLDHVFLEKEKVYLLITEFIKKSQQQEGQQTDNTIVQEKPGLFWQNIVNQVKKSGEADSGSHIFSYGDLIKRVTITSGQFDRKPLEFQSYILDSSSFDLTLELSEKGGKSSISVDDLRVQDETYYFLDQGMMTMTLVWDDEQITVEDWQLFSPQISFQLQGQSAPWLPAEKAGDRKMPGIMKVDALKQWGFHGHMFLNMQTLGNYLQVGQSHGEWQGTISGDLSFVNKPKINLDLKGALNNGMLAGFRLYDSRGNLRVTHQGIVFDQVAIVEKSHTYGSAVGEINWQNQSFDFTVSPEELGLKNIFDVVGLHHHFIDSQISPDPVEVKGTITPFVLDITGKNVFFNIHTPAIAFAWQNQKANLLPDCDLTYHFQVNGERFLMNELTGGCVGDFVTHQQLTSGPVIMDQMTARGSFPYDQHGTMGLQLDVISRNLNKYAYILGGDFGSASSEVSLTFSGPYSQLGLVVEGRADHFVFFDYPLGQVTAKMHYDFTTKILSFSDISGNTTDVWQASEGDYKKQSMLYADVGHYDFRQNSLHLKLRGENLLSGYVSLLGQALGQKQKNPHSLLARSAFGLTSDINHLQAEINVQFLPAGSRVQGSLQIQGEQPMWQNETLLDYFDLALDISESSLTLGAGELRWGELVTSQVSGALVCANNIQAKKIEGKTCLFQELFQRNSGFQLTIGTRNSLLQQQESTPASRVSFTRFPFTRGMVTDFALSPTVALNGKLGGTLG
ncbi:MAG: hypothetical protein OXC40_02190, partial [Proteobacteria bacterium]|nr:hypothetical protein [Pseudomonadota bacterium]